MFRFVCSECGKKLKAPKTLVGSKVECSHCSNAIVVPEPKNIDSGELRRTEIGKTQQITRKALIDHSTILEPDSTENLVDLINKQVEADDAAMGEKPTRPDRVARPEPPSPEPSPRIAVPVEVEAEPPIVITAEKTPDHPIAKPVDLEAEPPIAVPPNEVSPAIQKESSKTSQDTEPSPADGVPTKYRAGMVIGNFEIGYLLGEGAMGQVFSAKQLSMDRQVALKIIPPEVMNQEAVEQFNNEVRMLAKLSHQNIVTAYEAGEDKGIYYLAMAFIEGMALDNVLEEHGAVAEEEAINLIIYVATALKYAWDQYQMIHLDIKPSNIMIDSQGTVKLMDLGIAKIPTGKEGEQEHMVLGTPRYMSPEQAAGQPDLDWRSDQYSLGATLFHMLTGEAPFPSDDPSEAMNQHVSAPLRPPVSLNESLSKETNELVKRMMAKNRDKRFDSWDDLLGRLSEISMSLSKKGMQPPRKKGTEKNKAAKPGGRKARARVNRGAAANYGRRSGSFGSKLVVILFLIATGLILLTVFLFLGSQN